MPPRIIRLHDEDNVVVARVGLAAGFALPGEKAVTRAPVPSGHKIATRAIARGEAIVKYSQIIGFASGDIAPGDHVHSHNVEVRKVARRYEPGVDVRPTDYVCEGQRAIFQGFRRADGRVGVRNYLGILSSVNCSASVARSIAAAFSRPQDLADFPHVDGVTAFVHGAGCGMQAGGEGHENLKRVLAGYARHPNLAGVLMVGLGCEVAQLSEIVAQHGLEPGPLLRILTIQEAGGTRRTIEAGVAAIRAMLPLADRARRETIAASELVLALQCGGSDAYSGIAANPALGAAADLLVRHGGTAILSETPEIYGAEHLLVRRAASAGVAQKLIDRITWWEDYVARNGGAIDNNPAPGNKAGGLTTILEKALGAAAKGGTTNLVDVCRYGEAAGARGLVFMDSPGYDPVSVTGQLAAGATVVCFTTGRGSVFGCKPAPSLKIATNTPMYQRMSEDMDINCGEIVDGKAGIGDMGARIFAKILDVASGAKSKSEALGLGDNEFAPWQIGAVM